MSKRMIAVRVNTEEYKQIQEVSLKLKQSMSNFVRLVLKNAIKKGVTLTEEEIVMGDVNDMRNM